LGSVGGFDREAEQDSAVSTLTTRTDQVTLSAWSITLSRQTTALFQIGDDASPTNSKSAEQLNPREHVAEMAEQVRTWKDEGKISWRRARHLQKTLDLAAKALEHGRAFPAARLLRHVARVADKLAEHGKMPGDESAVLIESARSIVDQLREDAHVSKCCKVTDRAGVLLMKSEFSLTITGVTATYQSSENVAEV